MDADEYYELQMENERDMMDVTWEEYGKFKGPITGEGK